MAIIELITTTLCLLGLLGNVQAAHLVKQAYRTGFHFQPRQNFMNDPNGPMLYRGIYHLFYQYNPIGHGSSNGPRIWGHSTSTDLINWNIQPVTLKPQMSSNNLSSWSGSTTILPGNKPVILFTGLSSQNQQVQNLAVPRNLSDPYLKDWVLLPENPIMSPTLENKINPANFRDPTTAWILPDGRWRVVVGSVRGNRGMAMLFRSNDFIHWVQVKHPLYSEKNTGLWECPDFYPVYINPNNRNIGVDTSTIGPKVKHVLKVSLVTTQHDVYVIGTYDVKKDMYFPYREFLNESSLRYDVGNYYASKSFYDGLKNRRILFGWVKESLPDIDSARIGWAGIQAIPRSIWLDDSGRRLMQWPVRELESLRGKQINISNKLVKEGSLIEISGISSAQADVEIFFKLSNMKDAEKFDSKWTNDPQSLCNQNGVHVKGVYGPFGLLTLSSNGLEENTGLFFRIFNANNKPMVLMCSDQRRSTLSRDPVKTTYGTFVDIDPINEELSLRVLIDNSVVESYVGKGKHVITARVYPTLAIGDNAYSYIFNNGTRSVKLASMHAWSMKPAQIVCKGVTGYRVSLDGCVR